MRHFAIAGILFAFVSGTVAASADTICGNTVKLLKSDKRVDTVESRTTPVPHCYVHGTLGDDQRFRILLPQTWNGSFVQGMGPGLGGSETAIDSLAPMPSFIGEGFAYAESNQGHVGNVFGREDDWMELTLTANHDLTGYARGIIKAHYRAWPKKTLLFGHSGGGWRGLSILERYPDDYDGAAIGSPAIELRYLHFVRSVMEYYKPAFAAKLPLIVAARQNGENPRRYLTAQEFGALSQIYDAGVPIGSEYSWSASASTPTYSEMRLRDRSYFADFWLKSGYEGHDGLSEFSTVQITGSVTAINAPDSNGYILGFTDASQNFTTNQVAGYSVRFTSGKLTGRTLWIHVSNNTSTLINIGGEEGDLKGVKVGDTYQLDNSDVIAWKYYHRHMVQCDRVEYKNYCSQGVPRYVQRAPAVQKLSTENQALLSGAIKGKLILSYGAMDTSVYHMQIKEYVERARAYLDERTWQNLRVYVYEDTVHVSAGSTQTDWALGMNAPLSTSFKYLSDWVLKQKTPPADTLVNSITPQAFDFAATAKERGGLQPVIANLRGNGSLQVVKVEAGSTVSFTGTGTSPIGKIAKYEWDFESDTVFDCVSDACSAATFVPGKKVDVTASHVYTTPGTYVATVRVTDDTTNPAGFYSQLQNLGHIVVKVTKAKKATVTVSGR